MTGTSLEQICVGAQSFDQAGLGGRQQLREHGKVAATSRCDPERRAHVDADDVPLGASRSWPVYRLWVYIVVLAAALLIPAHRSSAIRAPVIWLTASAICYLLPYIIFANSAHFRYVWWPALAIFTASILRIDAILRLRTEARNADEASTHEGNFPKFRKRWRTVGEPN